MPQEIERRWILLRPQLDRLSRGRRIEQAYPNPYREPCLRVRIVNNQQAWLTTKCGMGLVRGETSTPIDLQAARHLYEATGFRLEKTRFESDGWEVDCYHGLLEGLVVLERELPSADVAVPTLPDWAGPAIEVTETLDNRRLAIMAAQGFDAVTIAENRVPGKIVLTGGPVAGKSTILELIANRFQQELHVIPEVATIAFGHLKIDAPADDDHARRYNQHACVMQRTFEDLGRLHAHLTGRKLVVFDRGLMDNVAYCPTILELIGSTREREYSEYALILHLAVPDEVTYYAHKARNPTRVATETYEVALDLERRIREAWGGHPNYHFIGDGDWSGKVNAVLAHIEAALAA